ncbi:LOW QUALITY PROTEIN: galactose-3-O-sulfotransferase 4-like [Amazona ochrocephala]
MRIPMDTPYAHPTCIPMDTPYAHPYGYPSGSPQPPPPPPAPHARGLPQGAPNARRQRPLLGAPTRIPVRIPMDPPTRIPMAPRSPPAPCPPRTHVAFLKTHKAGGSSVLNVLHRFGQRRRLRFALPRRYQFGYPRPFRAERVKGFGPRAPPFDIICHHMRFDRREVQRVMPNDTFYFSIIRDPAAAAASAFAYYRSIAPAFRNAPSLRSFLEAPERFAGQRGNHYAKNLQWFDFGLPPPRDSRALERALASVDRTFAMVMVAEHFDESLVLLREALCWPEDAVTAFAHNSRASDGVPALSPEQSQRLRLWSLDWALYTHVNRSFWRRVEAFGASRMEAEVSRLRRRREAASRRCLQGGAPSRLRPSPTGGCGPFQPPGRARILGYQLRAGLEGEERERCARMATPELQYKDILDRDQLGMGLGWSEWGWWGGGLSHNGGNGIGME